MTECGVFSLTNVFKLQLILTLTFWGKIYIFYIDISVFLDKNGKQTVLFFNVLVKNMQKHALFSMFWVKNAQNKLCFHRKVYFWWYSIEPAPMEGRWTLGYMIYIGGKYIRVWGRVYIWKISVKKMVHPLP